MANSGSRIHPSHGFSVKRWFQTNTNVVIAFLIGMTVGNLGNRSTRSGGLRSSKKEQGGGGVSGSIHRLADTPIRSTSHKDNQGRPITKQQFLEPFQVPTITGYSVATVKTGQQVPVHDHENMHEFFYILEGSATFQTSHGDEHLSAGTFLHFAPHEKHGIVVPENSPDGDMKMVVSGVVPN